MATPNKFYEEISRERMKDLYFIGRGAFGDIYRARHQDWGIDVAVKILSRLSSLMGQVSFIPWALRFRILYQVALGMNFLHSLSPPLLHLDLKLSNILLDADLHAKVADFGLSKFKRGTTQCASQVSGEKGGYGGTLEYLPPEAFSDLNYRPTPGTDVYSYGILMWSLLSWQEPYSSQRPSTDVLEKTENVPKLDDGIRLMKRCWHNEKVQRPSFRVCSQEMESVFFCHREQINAAVRKVQDILMQRKSSPLKETWLPSGSVSKRTSSAPLKLEKVENQQLVTASSGLEERFSTLRFEDSPSRQNDGRPRRPHSDTYVSSPFLNCPPGYLPYPQYFYGPHHQRDFGLAAPYHSLLPQFSPGASRGGIHIHGHGISGVQFGDNNCMHIVQTVEKKPEKSNNQKH
ncbi:hypothetical protein JD844_001166 [Phrynosoma platyrhinos]|uniref:Protein kinase domain-containing protein n=1 Tax=Phrynosoma platyrhinos TaxID=52577 RepID=A0ABQ7TA21_PHRPL|nr:hypothetical protein JD844_001166 [Phrynosoma platyrhinos]